MMSATTALPTSDPDLVEILRAYNDVTERLKQSHEVLAGEVHRLREQLRQKDRELHRRERLAALGRMAAGVAHEIRNPLGGIGLFASVLERDLADLPKQLGIARKIGAGVATVESIVRDILAFAGGAEPIMEIVAFGDVVKRVMEQVSTRVQSDGVAVLVDDSATRVRLRCDPGLVDRAFSNLVLNAVEAAGRGGHVWIRRVASPCGAAFVGLAVEDDGCGIDPARAEKIFHPFYTTKQHGTGLGLAIVHGIVEAHAGQVRVRPRTGGGSSFVMALPSACEIERVGRVATRVA